VAMSDLAHISRDSNGAIVWSGDRMGRDESLGSGQR
jgi:hypothetical protein